MSIAFSFLTGIPPILIGNFLIFAYRQKSSRSVSRHTPRTFSNHWMSACLALSSAITAMGLMASSGKAMQESIKANFYRSYLLSRILFFLFFLSSNLPSNRILMPARRLAFTPENILSA